MSWPTKDQNSRRLTASQLGHLPPQATATVMVVWGWTRQEISSKLKRETQKQQVKFEQRKRQNHQSTEDCKPNATNAKKVNVKSMHIGSWSMRGSTGVLPELPIKLREKWSKGNRWGKMKCYCCKDAAWKTVFVWQWPVPGRVCKVQVEIKPRLMYSLWSSLCKHNTRKIYVSICCCIG